MILSLEQEKTFPSFAGPARMMLEQANQRTNGSCEFENLIRSGPLKRTVIDFSGCIFAILKLRLYGSMQ